ncbi:MAG: SGNH/GDSL hydrolase family protein [Deltaproteobacteria bacterium]|jgi:hypothetical protein|nr:SGNH/GDSL hydrolase family protein [Deltaproteobacteria bacterium]
MRVAPCLLPLWLAACGAPLPEDAADDVPIDASSDAAPDLRPPQDLGAPVDRALPPDVPDAPDAPDVPDVPDVPTIADVPDVPDVRDVPDVPSVPDVPMVPPGPVLYPSATRHSPITAELVTRLRAISARGPSLSRDVFSKVGDSITVSTSFMACFASTSGVDLGGREHLRPTLDLYRSGSVGGTDPYRRVSLAATVGWSAGAALSGSPSPLSRELDAARPRAATVMFGTNDIQSRDIFRYGANLLDITDQAIARGVIPILSTVPPRDDNADADLWVPRYNAVVLGVAQSRGVPLVDLHGALLPLASHGLAGDHLHPSTYLSSAGYRACALTPDGLRFGYNNRNLLTLEALHRVAEVTLRGRSAPDADAPRLRGSGSHADPFVIPSLPFADARDTATGGARIFNRYPCRATADESGAEFLYRFTVTRPTPIRAMVITRGATDVDLHLLDRTATAEGCVARDDRVLVTTLAPGTWTFSLDTFVSAGTARAGEYLLVVVPG